MAGIKIGTRVGFGLHLWLGLSPGNKLIIFLDFGLVIVINCIYFKKWYDCGYGYGCDYGYSYSYDYYHGKKLLNHLFKAQS